MLPSPVTEALAQQSGRHIPPTGQIILWTRKVLVPTLIWVLVLEAIGAGIGMMTAANIENWYAQLIRSPLNPPGWVFGLVWPALYALIAIAGFRLWRIHYQPDMRALTTLFTVQIIMNWAWSFLFFGAHMLWVSCFWLIALIIIVAILISKAWRKERICACLLMPYLAWISFAAYLNAYIAIMN